MDGSISLEFVLILICIFLSGFFSSCETVLSTMGEIRSRKLIAENNRHANLLNLWIEQPDRVMSTILLGNTVAVISAAVLTYELSHVLFTNIHSAVIAVVLVAALLVLGELVPKTIARNNADVLVIPHLYLLRVFYFIFYPFTLVMNIIVGVVIKLFGKRQSNLTEEDIAYILDVSEEQGVLEEGTQQMISSILDISDTQVKEVMVPRTDMFAVSSDITKDELITLLAENEHSRIPVYEDTMDKVIGILYIKDLIKLMHSEWDMPDFMGMIHEAMFVPETKPIDDMLTEFQRQRQQMAIVVDEYGGVAGIVTMEDILEEIVGEIWDEYDDEEEQEIVPVSDTSYRVDARMNIDDLCDYFDIERTEDMSDFDTVGGLVYDVAGAIPSEGDIYQWRGYEIVITEMTENRLEEVEFIKLPVPETEEVSE